MFQVHSYGNGSCSQGIYVIYNCSVVSVGETTNHAFNGMDTVCPKNPLLPYIFRVSQDDVRKKNDLHIVHPVLGHYIWRENTRYRGYERDVDQYYWEKDDLIISNRPIPRIIAELKNQVERKGEINFADIPGVCKFYGGEPLLPCAIYPDYSGCTNCKDYEA